MEFRNPAHNANGGIDCEINHPSFGWIPFTASPDDPSEAGREIYAAALAANPAPQPAIIPTRDMVNNERNRRMRGTFTFNGTLFNCDADSLQRITGAGTLAGFAMGAGAQAGDLFWHGGESPFAWIAADNSIVTMDAQTAFAFGQAAARNETLHIFAAKALKDMDPIPTDYAADIYWP